MKAVIQTKESLGRWITLKRIRKRESNWIGKRREEPAVFFPVIG